MPYELTVTIKVNDKAYSLPDRATLAELSQQEEFRSSQLWLNQWNIVSTILKNASEGYLNFNMKIQAQKL
tara:strand:- start:554 stop:763 length:210 start_codon:yes stop_codon:yes gene_type:complete